MKRFLFIAVIGLLLLPFASDAYRVCGPSLTQTSMSQTGNIGVIGAPNSDITGSGTHSGNIGVLGTLASTMQTQAAGSESIVGNIGILASMSSTEAQKAALTGNVGGILNLQADRSASAVFSGNFGSLVTLASTMTPSGGGGSSCTAPGCNDNFNRPNSPIAWSGAANYGIGSPVTYSGSLWLSLQNSNTGNTPSEGAWWSTTAPTWGTSISYPSGGEVTYSGDVWLSLQGSNANNTPTEGSYWTKVTTGILVLQSTNWTTAPSSNLPTISSNHVGTSSGVSSAYWSKNTFADNHFSSALLAPASTPYIKTGVRVRQSASADTYYSLEAEAWDDGEGCAGIDIHLYKSVAGTRTQLGATYSDVIADCSTQAYYFKLAVSGSTLTPYKSSNGTSWTALATRTDSAIASGSAGIQVETGGSIDNWQGGDL